MPCSIMKGKAQLSEKTVLILVTWYKHVGKAGILVPWGKFTAKLVSTDTTTSMASARFIFLAGVKWSSELLESSRRFPCLTTDGMPEQKNLFVLVTFNYHIS